jgi:AraC-like DNA-binding protein
MNGKTYVSKPGYAVLTPEGASYHRVTDSDGLFPLINFYCSGLEDLKEIVVIPLDDPQDCIKRFKTLQRLFLRNESQMKIYSTFYDLLDQLMSPSDQNTDQLAFAMKYIEAHIQDPTLSNVELAKYLGISEVYLRKQFQACYHTTPKQYILDIRIRKAKQLLIDTPLAIAAIAEECGFSSAYHFCRCFKQRTGKTPTQYAKENKIYQI